MNPGILLALSSAVAYGAADFVGGVGARRHSSWQIVLVGQAAGAIVMLSAGLTLPGSPAPADFVWALLAGVGSATGSIFLYRGLAGGRMGLVAPVSAVGAAALPVLAGVAFGDRPSWLAWVGMLGALPGIWLVSRETTSDQPTHGRGAIADGAIAGVGFGILFIALAQISDDRPSAACRQSAHRRDSDGGDRRKPPTALAPPPRCARMGHRVRCARRLRHSRVHGRHRCDQPGGSQGVLASLYPAVTVLLAAGVLGERIASGSGSARSPSPPWRSVEPTPRHTMTKDDRTNAEVDMRYRPGRES